MHPIRTRLESPMKTFKVKFFTKHESYNGYDISDGHKEYTVQARNSESAERKAKKLWQNDHTGAHWIANTVITAGGESYES